MRRIEGEATFVGKKKVEIVIKIGALCAWRDSTNGE